MKELLSLITSLLIYTSLQAQVTGKIETDRPDQTESPYTVPKKWFQAEAGFGVAKDKNGSKTLAHPTLLSKFGLSNRFELRLITDYVSLQTPLVIPTGNKVSHGLQPIEIGGKVALFEEKGLRPKTSLIFHTSIPKAAYKEFQQSRWGPNFRFTMQHTVSETVSVGYNLGAEWDGAEEANPTYIYTLTSGFNLGDNWYAYAELFGFINSHTSPQHNVDGGIAYNFSSNTKIDLSYGFGITPHTSLKNYFALGFSFRLPLGKS